MEFRCLGPLEARFGGVPVDLGEPQQRLVLAILLARAGEVVPTDSLVDGIWGESPPGSARKIVQRYISQLRKALNRPEVIESRFTGYRIPLQELSLDATRFSALVAEASSKVGSQNAEARSLLAEALALWRGRPFEDMPVNDTLRPEIVRLELLHDAALQYRIEADIYAGEAAAVVPELAELTQRYPLQERLWVLRMLALYRTGRQAESLRVFDEARAELAESVGLEPSGQLRLMEQRVAGQDPVLETSLALARKKPTQPPHSGNPYKGLRAFEESDAPDFCGRDDLIRRLVDAVKARGAVRLVALAGPSGSGKSSVVRAGLLPRLREEGWGIRLLLPGAAPSDAIESAIRQFDNQGPSLLVIDQFEELFTLTDSDIERDEVLARLADVAESKQGPWVLLTLRADFLDRLLRNARFARLLETGLVLVPPLEDHEVRDIVVRPSTQAGTSVQPEVVAAAMREVSGSAAALPLLEYTLADLYDRAGGRPMTLEGYRAIGGLSGSLIKRAEEIYSAFGPGAAESTKHLFLRLVALADDGQPFRRRAPTVSLDGLEDIDEILETFGRHRLLTFDRDATGNPTVEVAHEALLTQWPRLGAWIESERDSIRLHHQLTQSAHEWNERGRLDGDLLTGARLARFSDGTLARASLGTRELSYLNRSKVVAKRIRRRRAFGAGAVIAVFGVLAMVAIAQRQAAQREARHATIRQVSSESTLSLAEDPERSILLAMEAVEMSVRVGETPLAEATNALHHALQTSRLDRRLRAGVANIAISPDGSLIATDTIDPETLWPTNEIAIWDARSGEKLSVLTGPAQVSVSDIPTRDGGARALSFSPDGRRLAVAYNAHDDDAPIVLWDLSSGSELQRLLAPGNVVWDPTWDSDGSLIAAASWDGTTDTVTVWESGTGRMTTQIELGFVGEIELYGTSTIAVTLVSQERVGFYDLATGTEVDTLATDGLGPVYLSVDPSHERIAVGAMHESLQVWDVSSEELQWSRPISASRSIVIDPGGNTVALAGDEGLVRLLNLEDGTETMTLAGHTAGVWGTVFHPDGTSLSSVGTDGETRTWDVSPTGSPSLGAIRVASGNPFILDFSPDGGEVAVSTWGGTLEYHATVDGDLVTAVDGIATGPGVYPVFSDDWRSVAWVGADGNAVLSGLRSNTHRNGLPPCTNPRALDTHGEVVVLDGLWLCLEAGAPAGADLRSRVVDVDSGDELLDLGERVVFRAAFNPGGAFEADRYLAVNIDPDGLEIYDTVDWDLIFELRALTTMIRFDPTGRYLVAGTLDGRAIVVDLVAVVAGRSAKDSLVMDAVVASGGVPGVAVTSQGVVATAAFDSSFIRLWNMHTGDQIAELRTGLDGSSPPQLNFDPEGTYLLYPDRNLMLRKYYLDPDRLLALAAERTTRALTDDECHRYLDRFDCSA